MHKIALFPPIPPEAIADRFEGVEIVGIGPDTDDPVAAAEGATVAVSDWSNAVRIEGDIVEALAPTCRLVQVPAAGVDSVDVDACAEAGIPVASCAGLNTGAVAEWCIWATIDALRKLTWSDRRVRDGHWDQLGQPRFELAGKTVGIIGLGDIGTATAERLGAFDVDLAYWSRRRRDEAEEDRLGARYLELDELFPSADVIILTVALTPDTRHLVDADRLAAMQANAVLVNAARGEVVDEAALADALREGQLHGAAVDVFSQEPPPDDHPLRDVETAVLTPHVGGASAESAGRILQRVLDNVEAVLDGREPVGVLDT
ncbi:MAG: 2-hydroxyacid dehydrogenase [Nitriliruptorales bacterium]|nr:2-hydroxyacid dehydrogenase [Nitriliruptorales bacterium]